MLNTLWIPLIAIGAILPDVDARGGECAVPCPITVRTATTLRPATSLEDLGAYVVEDECHRTAAIELLSPPESLAMAPTQKRTAISTPLAPAAIGPYSQAIALGSLLFTSGQVPLVPSTGKLIEGDIGAQTRQAIENLRAVLESAGSSLGSVLKTTVFLADMADFAAMNEVYAQYFPSPPPARSTVQVGRLPRDARIEIEAIAERLTGTK